MKRIFPILILLVMFLATACGSATPTAASVQVPAQPAATEAPSSGSGTKVDITLADNTITASTTTFQVGVPYTFVITNTGRHAHNFNINPPVSIVGSLDEALNKALLAVPQEQLSVGQSATVNFTFPDSAAGQLLEFSCLIRKHYEDGMHVDITVTK
ncbi:MAG TPA: hypothetical protein VK206_24965 [Anaerolineales bacterium]|nr:hypothetical protein [Anaerolineales bacterium]